MNSKFKNKVFDEMLIYASEQSALNIIKDLPSEQDLKVINVPSLQFETKMKKLINSHKRKEKYKKLLSISKRVAIILIIFILLSSITIMGVEAFRIKFFNIITEYKEKYTRFRFQDENINLDKNESNKSNVKSSNLIYTLTYIPEGYELLDMQEAGKLYRADYINKDKKLTFIQSKIDRTNTAMDTENAHTINIVVAGNEGYFIEREGINSLIWQNNEKVFTIHGALEEEELIKIGEGIKLQEK